MADTQLTKLVEALYNMEDLSMVLEYHEAIRSVFCPFGRSSPKSLAELHIWPVVLHLGIAWQTWQHFVCLWQASRLLCHDYWPRYWCPGKLRTAAVRLKKPHVTGAIDKSPVFRAGFWFGVGCFQANAPHFPAIWDWDGDRRQTTADDSFETVARHKGGGGHPPKAQNCCQWQCQCKARLAWSAIVGWKQRRVRKPQNLPSRSTGLSNIQIEMEGHKGKKLETCLPFWTYKTFKEVLEDDGPKILGHNVWGNIVSLELCMGHGRGFTSANVSKMMAFQSKNFG